VSVRSIAAAVFAGAAMAGCAPPRVAPPANVTAPACFELHAAGDVAASAPLVWNRPPEDGRAGRRAPVAWCAAVGPAMHVPQQAAQGRSAIDGIAIVTWNVHVGGGDVVQFVRGLQSGQFTGGAPVTDLILLLQETYRSGRGVPIRVPSSSAVRKAIRGTPRHSPRIDVVRAAETLQMAMFYAPSMRNGAAGAPGEDPEDRGNAILSTLPLTDLMAIELPFERQRRIAVAATVGGVTSAGTPWSVRVVSAHLDAGASAHRLWVFSSGVRAAQARALADALADARSVIVGADLNTWADGPFERAPRLLARAFNDTPPVKLQPTFGPLLLDYLFFRLPDSWRVETRRLDDTFGSDHRPVMAMVRF
jgi:endonuclease/exonuclease/phosphatase family metal-dependent hydrolase